MRSFVYMLICAAVFCAAWPAFAQLRPEAMEADGAMLLSVRTMTDLAGASLAADRTGGGVTATKGTLSLTLVPNRPQAMVNGRAVLLSVPVVQYGGNIYAPAGEVGRALGLRIGYDARARVLSVAPAIGKIERFSAGLKLAWIAGDFDGDRGEEVAYAVTSTYGTPTTRLWLARGAATAWHRALAGAAATSLLVRDVTGDGKVDLLVFATVMKGNKPVVMKYTYTWRGGTLKGISAVPAK
jgi:hypothetical protein